MAGINRSRSADSRGNPLYKSLHLGRKISKVHKLKNIGKPCLWVFTAPTLAAGLGWLPQSVMLGIPLGFFLFSQHLALALTAPARKRVTQNISVCAQMLLRFTFSCHLLKLSCQVVEADGGLRAASPCPGSLRHVWVFPHPSSGALRCALTPGCEREIQHRSRLPQS